MAEIDRYLRLVAEHKASDLHLCTGCKPIFRKDGSLVRLREDELDSQRVKTILNQELSRPVKESIVEPDQAWRTAVDKGDLMKQFESAGITFTAPEE